MCHSYISDVTFYFTPRTLYLTCDHYTFDFVLRFFNVIDT